MIEDTFLPSSVLRTDSVPPSRPSEEGGGMADSFPYEIWHYDHISGVGDNVDLEFIDECLCGAYELTTGKDTAIGNALKETE